MPSPTPACWTLPDGLDFDALQARDGLVRLDHAFTERVRAADAALAARFGLARAQAAAAADPAAQSVRDPELLLALAPHVDAFFADCFGLHDALQRLRDAQQRAEVLSWAKWKFVKRQAVLGDEAAQAAGVDAAAVRAALGPAFGFGDAAPDGDGTDGDGTDGGDVGDDAIGDRRVGSDGLDVVALDEQRFATQVQALVRGPLRTDPQAGHWLRLARQYAAWAALTPDGLRAHPDSLLFRLPGPVEPDRPVPLAVAQPLAAAKPLAVTQPLAAATPLAVTQRLAADGAAGAVPVVWSTPRPLHVRRLDRDAEPFGLTDPGPSAAYALGQIRYCLICHRSGKDSCSKGFADARRGPGDARLSGCPLGEMISEFHEARGQGHMIAALALIVVDNPMVAATGHRICNDCMRSCIFQQQDPVDIPAVETRVLRDVLDLPWGFEVLALLVRWNPMNLRRPLPAPATGRRVLVVGQGPAGFTLAHHLLNDGHAVDAIDGLKIEPLPAAVDAPLERLDVLDEPLDRRVPEGFGGVAEYGITVRWNKQYLGVVRMLLQRQRGFSLSGGVRFGGALDTAGAWALGYDHVALCIGAGRPRVPQVPNALARGVRTASDFLMTLQSLGASRRHSVASLQLRLPVLVVGAGLTAVDTATEALAYYVVQVERFLERHEALHGAAGDAAADGSGAAAPGAAAGDDAAVAAEFIAHARALRAERDAARREGRPSRTVALLQAWGGVTMVYRGAMAGSPAARTNPHELAQALDQGVRFVEHLAPQAVHVDAALAVTGVAFDAPDGARHVLPARSVLLAAGTQPNTIVADEDPQRFGRDGAWLRAVDAAGAPVQPEAGNCKPEHADVFVHRAADGRLVSSLGDLHPSWSGNVVRAMASARRGAHEITKAMAALPARSGDMAGAPQPPDALRAVLTRIERLTADAVELTVHAPLAAAAFRPGLFYRLQNFERPAPGMPARLLEPVALTGASVDRDAGLIRLIVLDVGASSGLAAQLAPGDPVVLAGPTGSPTPIVAGERVVLVGGGLGNAVLLSIGRALRAAGSTVLYVAGYRSADALFHRDAIEAAADAVVWCVEHGPPIAPARPADRSLRGTVVDALTDPAWTGEPFAPQAADRAIVVGSAAMMQAVGAVLTPAAGTGPSRFRPDLTALASVNAPMQCMMKGVCGQCVLNCGAPPDADGTHPDATIFTCAAQDQRLQAIDFAVLRARLAQNRVLEQQTAHWLLRCVNPSGVPGISGPSAPPAGSAPGVRASRDAAPDRPPAE